MRRGRVGPRIGQGSETGFLLGDRREGVQQVTGGSGEAVEPGHHQDVAGVELAEQPAKLRPVGLVALGDFPDDAAGAGFPQGGESREMTDYPQRQG